MKIAVITDTHFGVRGDSLVLLNHQEKFFRDNFFPTLAKHNIKQIIHMGDLFDRRKYINFVTLAKTKSMFLNVCRDNNINIDIVVGNHDTSFKNTNDVNSLSLLLQEYPNINVHYQQPVEKQYDNASILLCPWIASDNYLISTEAIAKSSAQVVMGHFELKGFEMLKGTVCEHGLDKSLFKKYDHVYSGHFHHPSSNDNITYLGAPYEMTWSDYAGKRGFHIFDTQDLSMQFIPNTNGLFRKIDYIDNGLTLEEIKELDVSSIEGSYIKVIAKQKTNAYLFEMFLEKLQSGNPTDIKVVDSDVLSESVEDVQFDEAEDTLTILQKYINSVETKTDKQKVLDLVSVLYKEAISI